MIKIINIVALLIVPVMMQFHAPKAKTGALEGPAAVTASATTVAVATPVTLVAKH